MCLICYYICYSCVAFIKQLLSGIFYYGRKNSFLCVMSFLPMSCRFYCTCLVRITSIIEFAGLGTVCFIIIYPGNHGNHNKNWVPSMPPHNLWLILMGMKEKIIIWIIWWNQKMSFFQIHQFAIFFHQIFRD